MAAHDIDLETCSRQELVDEIKNQRIEINNLLGSNQKGVDLITELRGEKKFTSRLDDVEESDFDRAVREDDEEAQKLD